MVASGLLLSAIIVSGSRAGLVGGGVVLLLVLLGLGRVRRRLSAVAVVTGVTAALLLSGVVVIPQRNSLARLTGASASAAEADAGRHESLEITLGRTRKHPLTGEGFEHAKEAHNVYLQILVSAGPVGLAGFLLLCAQPIRAFLLARTRPTDASLLAGLSAGLLGFLIASTFQNALWDRFIWFALGLVLTLLIVQFPSSSRPPPPSTRSW
jgi:O-antigen ligase